MPAENTSYWGEIITLVGTLITGFGITSKIKGAQDAKIKNVDDKVEDVKKSIDKNEAETKEEFEAQGKRIDNRVHINDLIAHKELIETKFKFICDSLSEIKDNSKKRRAGDTP